MLFNGWSLMFKKLNFLITCFFMHLSCVAATLVKHEHGIENRSALMQHGFDYISIRNDGLNIVSNITSNSCKNLEQKEKIIKFLAAAEYERLYGYVDPTTEFNVFILNCNIKNEKDLLNDVQKEFDDLCSRYGTARYVKNFSDVEKNSTDSFQDEEW